MNDIREVKTRSKIKHSLLHLLSEDPLSYISVSDLCKEAKISRTSFYKHYKNIRNVLEEAVDDLIKETLDVGNKFFTCVTEQKNPQLPMCEIIRKDKRYRAIITNEEVNGIFIDRLASGVDKKVINAIGKISGFSDDKIKTILMFQLSGCINAVRADYGSSDKEWKKKKETIDSFLKKAYQLDR